MAESWTENEAASKDWLLAFLKRNPDISIRKPEPTSQARASGFNKPVVQTFFDKLLDVYGRFGAKLTPNSIWNFDDTGIPAVVTNSALPDCSSSLLHKINTNRLHSFFHEKKDEKINPLYTLSKFFI